MDVSDILRDRAQRASGLQRMAAASLLGHLAVVAIIVVAPGNLLGGAAPEPRSVMTISLSGGAEGPKTGGLTSIGGREVQQATPPAAKPEPATPAAAATPAMTLPERGKPTKPTTTIVKNAPADARGRTPSRGAETLPGTAVIETGARGQGFGLSSSGGRSGDGIQLDVVNFCCPDYLFTMRDRIQQNVNLNAETSASVVIRFSIERDGTLKDPYVERRSGIDRLDIAAQRAIVITKQLPPLPAAYTHPSLVVHLTFEYKAR